MKKIVFYIDMLYRGGAQRVMSILVNYFAEHGYETILVNDFMPDPQKLRYPVHEAVRCRYLKDTAEGNAIKKNIERIANLRCILKEEKPDIVLSFLGRPNMRMLLASLGIKTRVVVSVRNDPNREYGESALKRFVANVLFCRADGCVFQTEDAKSYFWSGVQEKSEIIINPVEDRFYQEEKKKTGKHIITVGRVMEQKNHKLLINAFCKIANDFSDENLIIYGDDGLNQELSTHLKSYVKELGLDKRVLFAGNVANVEEILREAKIFVLSSDYEGMPNALMEAMASGLPCISTDCPCGGPKMLLKSSEGDNGMLVNCNDAEGMADALRKMLTDDVARETYASRGKRKAEQFKTEKILLNWETYLKTCSQ